MIQYLGINEIRDVVLRDLWALRKPLAIACAVILVLLPLVGASLPQTYMSETSIYVEEKNILGPLMEGAAVQSEVVDRARIAREIIYGRTLITKVLEKNGWAEELDDPKRAEQLIATVIARTVISNRGENLIRISYSDNDAERTYNVTRDIADLFIAESHEVKIRESETAFDFINRQVAQYEVKLDESEKALNLFMEKHPESRAGADEEVALRIARLKMDVQAIEQEQRETSIRERTLKRQLAKAANVLRLPPELEAKKSRLREMREKLETLLLSYTDTYPDVIRTRRQIADLDAELKNEIATLQKSRSAFDDPDPNATLDTVYGNIQRELYEVQTHIKTLESRLEDTRGRLESEIARSSEISDLNSRMVELRRDYEVNHGIHKDLLKRREIARVSMDLARERGGLTLRIDQPAYYPRLPQGLQGSHLMLAAPLLALLLPIGVVLGINQVDPRARHAGVVAGSLNLDTVIAVPHYLTEQDLRAQRKDSVHAALALAAGLLGCGLIVAWSVLGSG